MKMMYRWLLILLGVSIVMPSWAADRDLAGVFFGAVVADTSYEDDDEFDDLALSLKDSDSGYRIFAGYRFMDYVAIEVSHTDLGVFEFSGFYDNGEREVSATSVAAIGIWPIANSGVELFGKGGLSVIKLDTSVSDITADDSGAGFLLGIGVGYTPPPIPALSIVAGIDSHGFVVESSDGSEYTQGVAASYLGLRFNF